MTVYKVGQKIKFEIPLKVLRAFAVNHSIYYIVGVVKKSAPIANQAEPLWGVLNVDGSFKAIPAQVMKRATLLVAKENLFKGLG